MYRDNSFDSQQRPLANVNYAQAPYQDQYHNAQAPYQDQYHNASNAYLTRPAAAPRKQGVSKWIKVGIPLLIIVVAAGAVGAILAVRAHNKTAAAASSASGGTGGSGTGGSAGGQTDIGLFPTATDAYFLPVYPSATNTALYIAPTFLASATAAWPAETFQPATPDPKTVRPDRPRLIAPAAKWAALPQLIQTDPYLKAFHTQILKNATAYHALPVVAYVVDQSDKGSSGILDVSRQIKMRVKAYAYAYRMTNDTQWVDAAWKELQHAAGNSSTPWGAANLTLWNSAHFLDVAEMTAAFAIAYDWLYDAWTPTQRTGLMWSIINAGLQEGLTQYASSAGWWTGNYGIVISGNWNCVCNGGLTMGALAILGDDQTGTAERIIDLTVPNAMKNCALGPSSDGSWTETPNYWYFGTTGHAEMVSSLQTATGSSYGLLDVNPNFHLTGLYHMYVFGMTSLFDYADHGPNKYSTTANSMMLYGSMYNTPMYTLYQRDRFDAAEPWSMFWYDPTVAGAWWNGLDLDHLFDDPETYWASMRSSWTDNDGLYIAMKSSKLTLHQTHGDLDCGDFVLDAMGQRWAGELGSANYLSTEYFSSEADNATRWKYYRKRTEGQNTLLIDAANQLAVEAAPTVKFDSSGTAQGSSTVLDLTSDSTAYFTTDMSTAYGSGSSVMRGIRMLNGRKQVLLQDDITSTLPVEWRMHTNASVAIDSSGISATLTLESQVMKVTILNPPAGVQFAQGPAVRLGTDPPLPSTDPADQDQPNKGVTVLSISVPVTAGPYSLQVLFNPQWSGMAQSNFVTPPAVPVASWSLTSHSTKRR